MNISEIAESVIRFYRETLNQRCRILSVVPKDNDWEVRCEVNIDQNYTAIRGLGDMVEIYDVVVSNSKEILSFSLKETRRKAALDNE